MTRVCNSTPLSQTPVLHTLTETDSRPRQLDVLESVVGFLGSDDLQRLRSRGLDPRLRHRAGCCRKPREPEIMAPVNVGLGPNTDGEILRSGHGSSRRSGTSRTPPTGARTRPPPTTPRTGVSIEATASIPAGAKDDPNLTRRIVWAASKVLTPDHPLPGKPSTRAPRRPRRPNSAIEKTSLSPCGRRWPGGPDEGSTEPIRLRSFRHDANFRVQRDPSSDPLRGPPSPARGEGSRLASHLPEPQRHAVALADRDILGGVVPRGNRLVLGVRAQVGGRVQTPNGWSLCPWGWR